MGLFMINHIKKFITCSHIEQTILQNELNTLYRGKNATNIIQKFIKWAVIMYI